MMLRAACICFSGFGVLVSAESPTPALTMNYMKAMKISFE